MEKGIDAEDLGINIEKIRKPRRLKIGSRNFVVVPEVVWKATKETLRLLSVPGLAQSIRRDMRAPLCKLAKNLRW